MSEKERIINMLDSIPEQEFGNIIAYLQGIKDSRETEPDSWDLLRIAKAKEENNGFGVSFEEMLERDGLTYADLQN